MTEHHHHHQNNNNNNNKFPMFVGRRKYFGIILLGFKLLAVSFRLWESSGYFLGFFTSLGLSPFDTFKVDWDPANQTELALTRCD